MGIFLRLISRGSPVLIKNYLFLCLQFLQMDSAGSGGTLLSGIVGTIHYFCQNGDLSFCIYSVLG